MIPHWHMNAESRMFACLWYEIFYYAHFAPLSSLMPTYLSLIICFVISLLLSFSSYFSFIQHNGRITVNVCAFVFLLCVPFCHCCRHITCESIYTFEAWNLLIYLPNLIIKKQRLMFRQDDAHTYTRNLICITMMISWRHGITLDFIEVMLSCVIPILSCLFLFFREAIWELFPMIFFCECRKVWKFSWWWYLRA